MPEGGPRVICAACDAVVETLTENGVGAPATLSCVGVTLHVASEGALVQVKLTEPVKPLMPFS
jgi:hypothetical protein